MLFLLGSCIDGFNSFMLCLFLVKYLMIDFVFVRFELECVIFIILGVNKVV